MGAGCIPFPFTALWGMGLLPQTYVWGLRWILNIDSDTVAKRPPGLIICFFDYSRRQ